MMSGHKKGCGLFDLFSLEKHEEKYILEQRAVRCAELGEIKNQERRGKRREERGERRVANMR